jgi:hypothetical protein
MYSINMKNKNCYGSTFFFNCPKVECKLKVEH